MVGAFLFSDRMCYSRFVSDQHEVSQPPSFYKGSLLFLFRPTLLLPPFMPLRLLFFFVISPVVPQHHITSLSAPHNLCDHRVARTRLSCQPVSLSVAPMFL